MSKATNYFIYDKYRRKVVVTGTYDECLAHYNAQPKAYRKSHKLVSEKDLKIK